MILLKPGERLALRSDVIAAIVGDWVKLTILKCPISKCVQNIANRMLTQQSQPRTCCASRMFATGKK